MPIDALPPATNIVRFPSQRHARPTLELMRELAPDLHDVQEVNAVFNLTDPALNLRDRADAQMAQYIRDNGAFDAATPLVALDTVLAPMIAGAVAVCWAARDATAAVLAAHQRVLLAQTMGQEWLNPRAARMEALRVERAKLVIEAHARVEEAEGVARAVDFAQRGEPWMPPAPRAEAAAATPTLRSGYKLSVRAGVGRQHAGAGAGDSDGGSVEPNDAA